MKNFLVLSLLVALFLHSSLAKADETAPTPKETRMRSPAMVVAGSALSVFGTGALATGVYFLAHTGECQPSVAGSAVVAPPCGFYDGMNRLYGYSALAGGAALLMAGVPLVVVGAWRVPFNDRTAQMGFRIGASDIRFTATF